MKQKKLYLPGLVFPLLAAMAPKYWDVEVRLEVIEDINFDTDADIIGIGAMGHAIFRAFDLAGEFKKRGKIVFMGGYMASMIPELALKFADSIVIGDAEISFPKLLSDFEKFGCLQRIYDNPVQDLHNLPLPRYELLAEKRIGDMLPVQAGRGCNHTCSFCSIACLYKGRHLVRPVDEVIRDIEKIKSLGYHKFYMIDDNIVSNPAYLEELCRKILPLKMKWSSQCTMNLARNESLLKLVARSGCEILSLGLESISQEGLDKLNKKWLKVDDHQQLMAAFNKAGIMVSAEMIIGTDGDTTESLNATYDFIRKCKIPLLRIYFLTPVPTTQLYIELKAAGRLIHENFDHYTASECVHYPEKMSPEQLTEMYHWLNGKIFSLHGIISRTLLNKQILKYPLKHIFAFAVNLHYRSYVKRGETPLIV
ncbi:MAG: B12-binding domain-containing radical SAM protein [Bacteroidales bacterium]|nr:B12-binding domain-containing radical SAM protein [Bacteroidales bacterium]